jgi:hypothetical protein
MLAFTGNPQRKKPRRKKGVPLSRSSLRGGGANSYKKKRDRKEQKWWIMLT